MKTTEIGLLRSSIRDLDLRINMLNAMGDTVVAKGMMKVKNKMLLRLDRLTGLIPKKITRTGK